MVGRSLLALLILVCLMNPQDTCAQTSTGNTQVSLDSTITLIDQMLKPEKMEMARFKIDSVGSILSAPGRRIPLLTQLRYKNLLGKYYLSSQKLESWPDLYQWCLGIEVKCTHDDERNQLARLLNNAGIAFKRMDRFSESEQAYLKSSEILRKVNKPDLLLFGSVFANAGNALRLIGEYDRSVDYLEQSIAYFDEYAAAGGNPAASIAAIANAKSTALDNLGVVYVSLGDHEKAIEIFNKCLDFKKKYYPRNINNVYTNLINSLIEVGKITEAKSLADLVLSGYGDNQPKDPIWALTRMNLADIQLRLSRDTLTAIQSLRSLNALILDQLPAAVDVAVSSEQIVSNLYSRMGRPMEALGAWAKAIQLLSITGQKISPVALPEGIKTLKFNKLIELTNLNAQIYLDWGTRSSNVDTLRSAEKRFDLSLHLIDSLRNSLELQSSKLQVSRMQRVTYNQLMDLQFELWRMTRDTAIVNRLFNTMEQSKSAGLWSSVKDIELKTSMIPKEELELEKSYQNKIADIQGKLIQSTSASTNNPAYTQKLQEENLFYIQQIDSLKNIFRQKYPEYFQARFDHTTITLQNLVGKLNDNQVLIEYALTDANVFIFTVSTQGFTLDRIPNDQKLSDEISYLRTFLKGNTVSLTASARTRYCDAASGLFGRLLGPSVTRLGEDKDVIIIPDGPLSYIPFEVLLKSRPDPLHEDFRKLPYLIRDHAISYGLTATLYYYQPMRQVKPSRRILAVAPTYDFSSTAVSPYLKKVASGLPELKGTVSESRSIRRMVGGKLLAGSAATEERFKKIAPQFGILHLAMHTLPDNNNSLNSSLIFTPGADQTEDGILYGHEVYNLSLNASLTVLSACETGTGQMVGGEGVLSFGRAFLVAGCPNLIMTLWTVDDRSSQDIMVSFYKSLLSGSKIAHALRISKLNYLKKVDQLHAHPHFWAGFVELGQNRTPDLPARRPAMIYIGVLILMTLGIFILTHRKKNPRV